MFLRIFFSIIYHVLKNIFQWSSVNFPSENQIVGDSHSNRAPRLTIATRRILSNNVRHGVRVNKIISFCTLIAVLNTKLLNDVMLTF